MAKSKIRIPAFIYENVAHQTFGPGLFPNQEVHMTSPTLEEGTGCYIVNIEGPNVPNTEWCTAEVDRKKDMTYVTRFIAIPDEPKKKSRA